MTEACLVDSAITSCMVLEFSAPCLRGIEKVFILISQVRFRPYTLHIHSPRNVAIQEGQEIRSRFRSILLTISYTPCRYLLL